MLGVQVISFKSPWLLLALLLLGVAVGIWLLAERRRQRYPVRYTNVEVLATVVSGRSWLRLVPAALVLAALACLLVGVARPQVQRQLLKEHATVILVVDTSRSMQAKDVAPTRLGAAQEAIKTFLDHAPKGLRVGLVVFAGEAQVATPPTKDHELVESSVEQIDQYLIFGGTAIGDALQTAVELGKQVTGPDGSGPVTLGDPSAPTRTLQQAAPTTECRDKSPVSILFLSDGSQTRGCPAAARRCGAREARMLPRLHSCAGDAERRDQRNRIRRRPRLAGHGSADPGASRPGHAPRHREDDRRWVHRGSERGNARERVPEPRLEAGS